MIFYVHFQVALDVVALMRQDVGATFVLGEDSREDRSYSNGIWFEIQDSSNTQKGKIVLLFAASIVK